MLWAALQDTQPQGQLRPPPPPEQSRLVTLNPVLTPNPTHTRAVQVGRSRGGTQGDPPPPVHLQAGRRWVSATWLRGGDRGAAGAPLQSR